MNDGLTKKNVLLILGMIFIAFNLRPAITSVGPLISSIRTDTGISNSTAGFITTLPLLAFALLSPIAPKIAQRIGKELTLLIALIILGVGILTRSTGMIFSLMAGTVLIGIGITFCNVLLPGIVKQSFSQKVGLMTGIYTLSMGVWAGIAPGISVPLAKDLHMGWQKSLSVWEILVFIAILMWLPQLKTKKASQTVHRTDSTTHPLWSSPLAWQVSIFMGLQSLIYYCFITWLPEMLYGHGISIATAGWLVSVLQFSGLPANFIIPVLADKLPNQRGLAFGTGALCFSGILGLLFGGNLVLLTICIIFIGVGTGAAVSLALTLIGLRAANAEQAANLSGMAQSVGYLLAAIGPIALGFLFDLFHTWTYSIILLGFIALIMTWAGLGAGRNEFVLQRNIGHSVLNIK